MKERLLQFLCCPHCREDLSLEALAASDNEILSGVLFCENDHFYPIIRGIPRMLPDAMAEHWPAIKDGSGDERLKQRKDLIDRIEASIGSSAYDKRTHANFSNEWDNHDIGAKTWTMELEDRVKWFFLDPIRIDYDDLKGRIVLDAGC